MGEGLKKGKTGRQKGCIPWNKGKTGVYSEETLRKIGLPHKGVSPFEGHNWGPVKCKKCGKNHGIHPRIGTHDTPETLLKLSKIRTGRKLTPEWKENISLGFLHRAKETVRKLYNLPETAKFVPVSVSEHNFARRVLIEGKPGDGLISGWDEDIPEFKKEKRGIIRMVQE